MANMKTERKPYVAPSMSRFMVLEGNRAFHKVLAHSCNCKGGNKNESA